MIEQIRFLLEEAFRQESSGLYFLMFGGGLLAALTPCTYPVLPLTVGYIGNQAGADRRRAFLLSLSLVTGMAAVYAVLGSIVAAVGGTFGSIMGNGWAVYAIALFYLMMGLALLDVFPFPIPGFISRLQTKSSNSQGIPGAFVIGGVSGLIVGPCTGPILAVALGAIALTLKNVHGVDYVLQVLKGGVLLFLFGFGQGALILLAGIFTGFISKLPRAGAWMETVKKGFALVVIIASSLLFVFVGQNTDFPSLTRVLASSEPAAAPAPKPDTSPVTQSEKTVNSPANPAPDFTLASLGKGQVTLSRLKGKKGVVLVFFATWCVNCVREVPEIKRFAETAKKENIAVLCIDYQQEAEIVKRFKKSAQINYEILLDTDGTVTTEKYGIRGIPHIVGINAKGDIIYRGTALPDDKAAFIKNLQQCL
jgi:cytochrome c-type biogenesis protein